MNTLLACAVCFGASDSLQFKSTQIGILVLLGFTVVILGAFAAFFIYLKRRGDAAAQPAIEHAHGGSY